MMDVVVVLCVGAGARAVVHEAVLVVAVARRFVGRFAGSCVRPPTAVESAVWCSCGWLGCASGLVRDGCVCVVVRCAVGPHPYGKAILMVATAGAAASMFAGGNLAKYAGLM